LLKQTIDALEFQAEEGRGWWRNSSGRYQQPIIRRCPNGETSLSEMAVVPHLLGVWTVTWGTEISKYPEEKKSNEILSVATSEEGRA
jgi:hypothetical protein